jgi:hypothetical protein
MLNGLVNCQLGIKPGNQRHVHSQMQEYFSLEAVKYGSVQKIL